MHDSLFETFSDLGTESIRLRGLNYLPSAAGLRRILDDHPEFDDVIFIGGDLTPAVMVAGYRIGLFPMYADDNGALLAWFAPKMRCVLPLPSVSPSTRVEVPKSVRKEARSFTATIDSAFSELVHTCGALEREGRWIESKFESVYGELHTAGLAHSVEIWDETGSLVGGLFGVGVGGLFSGESMFSIRSGASKVAFAVLRFALARAGYTLIDGQWPTAHLLSLGMIEVPRETYVNLAVAASMAPAVPLSVSVVVASPSDWDEILIRRHSPSGEVVK